MRAAPEVTVIIPTCGRKEKLRSLLLSLGAQTFPFSRFDVIVADDGGTDGTKEMVKSLPTPYRMRYTATGRGGPAKARNRGASLAGGNYLLFLDDDVIATAGLIAAHVKMHGERKRCMVMGKVLPLPGTGMLTRKIMDYSYALYRHGDVMEFNAVTANLSLERVLMEKVGGFRELFTGVGCEDTEFGFRLRSILNLPLIYNEEALAWHDKTLTACEAARSQFNTGRFFIWALRASPAMLSRRYSIRFSRNMTSLLAFTGRYFRVLTVPERERLLSDVDRYGELMKKKPSLLIEERLEQECLRLIDYSFAEGMHCEAQKLPHQHSLLERIAPAPVPSQQLTGIPLEMAFPSGGSSWAARMGFMMKQELSRRGFLVRPPVPGRSCTISLLIGAEAVMKAEVKPYAIGYLDVPPGGDALSAEGLAGLDEVWVPSEELRKSFEKAWRGKPLHVMAPGVDRALFRPGASMPLFEWPGHFTILAAFEGRSPGGLELTAGAYFREFGAAEKVLLAVAWDGPPEGLPENLAPLQGAGTVRRKSPAAVVLGSPPPSRRPMLYASGHLLVHQGATAWGFLTALEAKASALPSISTAGDSMPCPGIEMAFEGISALEKMGSMLRFAFEHRDEIARKAWKSRNKGDSEWDSRSAGERMARRLWEIAAFPKGA
ncbi:MAG: glycosyltransferase [Candidatus Eremiobacteraeota bacterium]|nr:glycosyltransferase [Candidatus Eremiobacteraeota bacterium]